MEQGLGTDIQKKDEFVDEDLFNFRRRSVRSDAAYNRNRCGRTKPVRRGQALGGPKVSGSFRSAKNSSVEFEEKADDIQHSRIGGSLS